MINKAIAKIQTRIIANQRNKSTLVWFSLVCLITNMSKLAVSHLVQSQTNTKTVNQKTDDDWMTTVKVPVTSDYYCLYRIMPGDMIID